MTESENETPIAARAHWIQLTDRCRLRRKKSRSQRKALVANVVDDEDDAKPTKVYFKNCIAARAAGYLDMHRAASLLMSNSQC
jgi:hypothetical protein